ncbi:pyridoxamine 5'-phosphate oxidase family protein [Nocardioides aurantiacus]|uniref:pyridoxamine 5'-phosphate oxidase family protein n=1 Tax=Nocardioides aurantiacus TaxID=86796 RepID=UPI00403F4610
MTVASRNVGVLRELSEVECWKHLVHGTVGRIAYVDPAGPVVLPLNYVVQDGLIWFRTASYDQLAIHAPGQRVAFEVDHVDERARTGWSVLVRGRAAHALRDDPGAVGGWPDPTPWPAGNRSMVFCVTPTDITGRALARDPVRPVVGHGPGTVQRADAG